MGNRLSETRGSTTTSYSYDGAGMNLLTSTSDGSTTVSFGYDAYGNLVSKSGGWAYAWNFDGLLSRVTKDGSQVQAYRYDALGRRVKVDGASAWTVSLFSGMDTVYEVDQGGAKTKYVRANGILVAKVTPSGAFHYYLGDHLGSTRQVRAADRSLVFSAEYEPFGKAFANSASESFKFTGE
jgi:YD repeat-containing protein